MLQRIFHSLVVLVAMHCLLLMVTLAPYRPYVVHCLMFLGIPCASAIDRMCCLIASWSLLYVLHSAIPLAP